MLCDFSVEHHSLCIKNFKLYFNTTQLNHLSFQLWQPWLPNELFSLATLLIDHVQVQRFEDDWNISCDALQISSFVNLHNV